MHRRQALLILTLAAASGGADFSGPSAFEFTRKVVSFGPRPVHSLAIERLRAWMLATLARTGARIEQDRFTAATPIGPVPMVNVIARFAGVSGRAIVISGHYDTKILPEFAGANDGGSSTGLLLEFARALAGQKRRDDVWLVWFDGEEAVSQWSATDGLYGSRHLAERWSSDGTLGRIRALINVDMIGDRDLGILEESNSSPELRKLVREAAREKGFERHFLNREGYIEDDHIPFVRRGVPAVDLIDFDYGPNHRWWHTPQDTMDKLDPRSFEAVGRTVLEVVRRLEAE
jgi:Zn-dependent M28 family amino/carboxypeptidase